MHTMVDHVTARVENCEDGYDVLRACAAAMGVGFNFDIDSGSATSVVGVESSRENRTVYEVILRLVVMEATLQQISPNEVYDQLVKMTHAPDKVPPLPNLDPAAA